MLPYAKPCNKPDKDFHGGNTGSIPVRDATYFSITYRR